MKDVLALDAVALAERVRSGSLKPAALVGSFLDRVDALNGKLNAVLAWDRENALVQARAVEGRIKAKEQLPMAGIPVFVKDNICTSDYPTTCASKMLAGYQSPYEATVVEKLRQSGAIILGKTNLDEFAMGSSNENSAFGPVGNPWNTEYVSGGSSGGSAAAVAAAFSPIALGSDTGGSIRQPASFCGVAGLKPTYGAVSRYGLVAFGSSLDQVGPFARSVRDLALVMSVLAGPDSRDATSTPLPYDPQCLRQLKSKRPEKIGIIKELMTEGISPDVLEAVENALDQWRQTGVEVVEVSIPSIKHCIAAYYLLATAEASSNLSRFDGVRFGYRELEGVQNLKDLYNKSRAHGFGREVKQRIMLGTFALSAGYHDAYYDQAIKVRDMLKDEVRRALGYTDVLVSPTTPSVAFRKGEKIGDPMAMYAADLCTIMANLTGIPALSVPCGMNSQNLPVGLQIMGGWFEEPKLLEAAYGFEKACGQQPSPNL